MTPNSMHLRLLVKSELLLVSAARFVPEVKLTMPLHAYCRSLWDLTAFGMRLSTATAFLFSQPGWVEEALSGGLKRWRLQAVPGVGLGSGLWGGSKEGVGGGGARNPTGPWGFALAPMVLLEFRPKFPKLVANAPNLD